MCPNFKHMALVFYLAAMPRALTLHPQERAAASPKHSLSRAQTISLGGLGLLSLRPPPAVAKAEWACALDPASELKVEKRLESSVRIRPETMLLATNAKTQREVKLVKVPLGQSAAASFDPPEQIELSRYFSSRQAAEALGPGRVAAIFRRSLEKQVASPRSPLEGIEFDESKASVAARNGRRYVAVDYVTYGCRRLDEDGACVGRSKRLATSVITVSLEAQARTNEERRRMDRGDLEERSIDTLWLFTASAPATTRAGKPIDNVADVARA